jgi:hypothetical protein
LGFLPDINLDTLFLNPRFKMIRQLFSIEKTESYENLEKSIKPEIFDENSFLEFLNFCDGSYHIWYFLNHFRNKISSFKLRPEFLFLLVKNFPKNYQLWNYINLNCPFELKLELSFFALDMDHKNYHAWEIICLEGSNCSNIQNYLSDDPNNNSVNNFLFIKRIS